MVPDKRFIAGDEPSEREMGWEDQTMRQSSEGKSGDWRNKMVKQWLKNAFYHIVAIEEKKILSTVRSCDTVSFDVFDTLLKRDVLQPRDVFSLMEKKLIEEKNAAGTRFAVLRIQTEQQVRKEYPDREVTLAEIYQRFPYPEKEYLMRMECELEIALSTANPKMKRIYDECVRQGKKIIFISDMYHSSALIRELLNRSGYGTGNLYVSSESGFTKHSGKLFRFVEQQEHLKRSQWVHIGDSIRADFIMPKKLGIRSVLIRQEKHNPYVDRQTMRHNQEYRLLNHFIDVRIDRYDDPYEHVGYSVLGPLLYGFSCWLRDTVPKDEHLVFLAREGFILQKAFKVISSRSSTYLYVSRKSARGAYVKRLQSIDDNADFFQGSRLFEKKEIAKRYGLSDQEIESAFAEHSLTGDSIVQNDTDVRRVLQAIWPRVSERANQQYEYMQQYLKQLKLPQQCAAVDVGWAGTMQALLNACKFQTEIGEYQWRGYYFGEFEDEQNPFYAHQMRSYFLFDAHTNQRIHDAVKYSRTFFETLFLAPHGSTKAYGLTEKGAVIPEMSEVEHSKEVEMKIACIHNSAIDFVRDIHQSVAFTGVTLDPETAAGNYSCLARVPRLRTLRLFDDFTYEDGNKFKFSAAHDLGFYLLHPGVFAKDFKNSLCKAWFLKSIFKIPLPYIAILNLMRKAFFMRS